MCVIDQISKSYSILILVDSLCTFIVLNFVERKGDLKQNCGYLTFVLQKSRAVGTGGKLSKIISLDIEEM